MSEFWTHQIAQIVECHTNSKSFKLLLFWNWPKKTSSCMETATGSTVITQRHLRIPYQTPSQTYTAQTSCPPFWPFFGDQTQPHISFPTRTPLFHKLIRINIRPNNTCQANTIVFDGAKLSHNNLNRRHLDSSKIGEGSTFAATNRVPYFWTNNKVDSPLPMTLLNPYTIQSPSSSLHFPIPNVSFHQIDLILSPTYLKCPHKMKF